MQKPICNFFKFVKPQSKGLYYNGLSKLQKHPNLLRLSWWFQVNKNLLIIIKMAQLYRSSAWLKKKLTRNCKEQISGQAFKPSILSSILRYVRTGLKEQITGQSKTGKTEQGMVIYYSRTFSSILSMYTRALYVQLFC